MSKCYIVGIDGGSWKYIQQFRDSLPNFNKIIRKGSSGPLKSTIPPLTASAWTSFLTGVNPGKHGIFDFFRREGYKIRMLSSKDKKVPDLGDILSLYKKKVGMINVPMTYPPKRIDGVIYSGFPMPEERKNHTYPPKLLEELHRELGNVRTQPRVFYSENTADEFVEDILFTHESLIKISDYILSNYNFDLYIVVFGAIDALSHAFWSCIWGEHPYYGADECKKYSLKILDLYRSVDKYIGRLIKELEDGDLLVIMSDHGFGSLKYTVFINKWLNELGLLNFKNDLKTKIKMHLHNCGLTLENIYKMLIKLNLHSTLIIREFRNEESVIKKIVKLIREQTFLSFHDIDWKNTKAFALGTFGQIYVNLRGRDPMGIVEPSEYGALINYIINELKKLKNPITNKKMFDLVYRGDEIYSGKYTKYAPDIVFLDSTCEHVTNRGFEFGSNKLISKHVFSWSGTHDLHDGILFLCGEDIKEKFYLNNVKIIDIAPTILHFFGLPIPKYSDGKVIGEVFKKESQHAQRVPKYVDFDLIKIRLIRNKIAKELKKKQK